MFTLLAAGLAVLLFFAVLRARLARRAAEEQQAFETASRIYQRLQDL